MQYPKESERDFMNSQANKKNSISLTLLSCMSPFWNQKGSKGEHSIYNLRIVGGLNKCILN